jgi:hypothetical protein
MHFHWLLFALCALLVPPAHADPRTVCTITVNSADEKEALQRHLPPEKFRFVELVERGRPDWLASACRQGVQCDVLVISGHYDGGNEFFSDRLESREFLPVDEMERAACSESCPGLFSQLKEVYLFGCNTLNAEPTKNPSAEIARSLMRSGHNRTEAGQLVRALGVRHGESGRDRMRQIFKDVPVIYGFSSVAPLGPVAGPLLGRHLQAGTSDFATGYASSRMLRTFSAHGMTVTAGMRDTDPQAGHRRDICQFADDRAPADRKTGFVHSLLRRDMAEVRMFLDRLERFSAVVSPALHELSAVRAREDIARDEPTRSRYLAFARDADLPSVRARMLAVASSLGWLAPDQHRTELVQMFNEQLANSTVSPADVDLVCALNIDGELDQERERVQVPPLWADRVAHAAFLACLGSPEDHARVLRALTGSNDDDVLIAQVYLRHRPIDDMQELRAVTDGIVRMSGSAAQVRALQVLASHRLEDHESLVQLTRLYPVAESVGVQTAIAGILIRSDYRAIASPQLLRTLQEHRLKSPGGRDAIDVLIRRLQAN